MAGGGEGASVAEVCCPGPGLPRQVVETVALETLQALSRRWLVKECRRKGVPLTDDAEREGLSQVVRGLRQE